MEKTKLTDDEVSKHPFYSSYGIKLWKKRMKELANEEKEIQKKKSRKDTSQQGIEGMEAGSLDEGGEQVRMVRDDEISECPSYNRQEMETPTDKQDELHSPVPKVPQVRPRNSRSRKPSKNRDMVIHQSPYHSRLSGRMHKRDDKK